MRTCTFGLHIIQNVSEFLPLAYAAQKAAVVAPQKAAALTKAGPPVAAAAADEFLSDEALLALYV